MLRSNVVVRNLTHENGDFEDKIASKLEKQLAERLV